MICGACPSKSVRMMTCVSDRSGMASSGVRCTENIPPASIAKAMIEMSRGFFTDHSMTRAIKLRVGSCERLVSAMTFSLPIRIRGAEFLQGLPQRRLGIDHELAAGDDFLPFLEAGEDFRPAFAD